jgi:hypothetical protein
MGASQHTCCVIPHMGVMHGMPSCVDRVWRSVTVFACLGVTRVHQGLPRW